MANFYYKQIICIALTFVALLCSVPMGAQETERKGQVVDAASGDPLVGVGVLIQGTLTGSITDLDGNFVINAADDAILVISYMGYKEAQIPVNGRASLGRIAISEDTELLDEVIVVGYGIQKKASSVGSITATKGDDLLKVANVNTISEALQGQMPGVVSINSTAKPGAAAADIFIRGKSTWGDASPLVLVDGIERDFNDVDVNEIESISVLKDASATAVYGVKGANGVILLTTKRGTDSKPEISFTSNFGFKQPSGSPDYSDYVTSMKQYNAAQAHDAN